MDKTLEFGHSDNYNVKIESMWVKQFSFQVPPLDTDMLDFYVHCELSVCSTDGSGFEQGIPMVSELFESEEVLVIQCKSTVTLPI